MEQSGDPDEVYRQGGIYKDIVDASARSLNIEKLAQTLDSNGDTVPRDLQIIRSVKQEFNFAEKLPEVD